MGRLTGFGVKADRNCVKANKMWCEGGQKNGMNKAVRIGVRAGRIWCEGWQDWV
jgi:hypothetical protein